MASVEVLEGLQRRLSSAIPQQTMKGEIENRLKRLGRTAKVHGFRPGKVPYKILEQQYGAQIHQEVLGENLERAFAAEVQASNLKVVGTPTFELKSTDYRADPLEYSATFEIYPDVTIGDISSETVERSTCDMSESDVDHTIESLRKQRTVHEPVNRAAQNGDRVLVDFTGKLNGQIFEGGEAKNFAVDIGAGRMLADFENALVGMSAGATKSFDMTFPENYQSKDLAGKQVTFTVTLHSVEAPRLPDVDAEFARQLGIADGSVDKLRADVRENLERELERRLKVRNKDSAMEALLKVSNVELPKTLVNWEAQNLVQQAMRDMEERGVKIPRGMGLPPEMFTERAEKRVKLGLVLAELVKQHELTARPEQVKEMIQDYSRGFDQPEQVVRWYTADPDRMREIENLVLEDNVVTWVMSAVKVIDKPVTFNELMGNAQ